MKLTMMMITMKVVTIMQTMKKRLMMTAATTVRMKR